MFLYRAATKEIIELESQFMPLGLLPTEEEIIYQGEELSWYPDDVLVMYSDGITEAENPKEDMYGGDRLKDSISTSASLSPSEIQQAILADLEAHCQGQLAADDITLVVLKWK
jgi:serine phosphatase RsbU (regulator of sigma subunit)